MANNDTRSRGFVWSRCLLHGTTTPLYVKGTLADSQTITKGDPLVFSGGELSAANASSGTIHGIAAEAVTTSGSTATIHFIPALPWYVFTVQVVDTSTYAQASHDFNAYDLIVTSNEFELDLGNTTEKVFMIIGPNMDPNNDYTSASNTDVDGVFIRSSYLPLLAATA